jgi:formylglycine-generating enzyme required for sulfatase activity
MPLPIGPGRPIDAAGQVIVAYDAERVLHGGSFLYRIESTRAALRSKYKPGSTGSTIGFRVTRTLGPHKN